MRIGSFNTLEALLALQNHLIEQNASGHISPDKRDRIAAVDGVLQRLPSAEHTVAELIAQRVYGLALGYEDLNDHDQLRHSSQSESAFIFCITLTRSYRSRAISRAPLGRLQKNIPTGQTRYAHDALRVPAVHKDERPPSIAFTVGLLYGPQGNVTGIVAGIRDETARFAQDRNLRKRLAELEQRERISTTTEAPTRK